MLVSKERLVALLSEMVTQPGVAVANAKAGLGVLTRLIAGLNVVEARPAPGDGSASGGTLRLTLRGSAVGEIATRSRAPAELYMAPELCLSAAAEGSSLVVRLDGFFAGPVDGAMDVWLKLKELWMAAGVGDSSEWVRLAWEWWRREGHAAAFADTKFWRVVESLAGHRGAPSSRYKLQLMKDKAHVVYK